MNQAGISAPQLERLLTVPDLARLLNKPHSWVYNNSRQLPFFRIGRELRFRESDIARWLEEHREGGPYVVR